MIWFTAAAISIVPVLEISLVEETTVSVYYYCCIVEVCMYGHHIEQEYGSTG